MRKALFLDRDGVINVEVNHLFRIQDCHFISGIFDSIRAFYREGYDIIIITNQAGIAKGKYNLQDYITLRDWMHEQFLKEGVPVTAEYMCPHHPEITGSCSCRKPEPGMIFKAIEDLGISPVQSVLVGDKKSDIEAGLRAGIGRLILVRSGHKVDESISYDCQVFDSLADVRPQ